MAILPATLEIDCTDERITGSAWAIFLSRIADRLDALARSPG